MTSWPGQPAPPKSRQEVERMADSEMEERKILKIGVRVHGTWYRAKHPLFHTGRTVVVEVPVNHNPAKCLRGLIGGDEIQLTPISQWPCGVVMAESEANCGTIIEIAKKYQISERTIWDLFPSRPGLLLGTMMAIAAFLRKIFR